MSGNISFLGRPAPFKEAFPEIKSLRVEIEQDKWLFHSKPTDHRTSVFTEHNIPPTVSCRNLRCQQGGIELQQTIYFMVQNRETQKSLDGICNGHEGTPKGRRIGNPCDNGYAVNIEITYKNDE